MPNGVFNFNFLAPVFSEILGGSQIYIRGPYAPCTPPGGEIFFTQSEYFAISNSFFFKFQHSSSSSFRDFRGSQIYVKGPCAPCTPLAEFFFTRAEYVTMSNGVFNFNSLALLLSEILGRSKIYTRGRYSLWTPPSGEIFVPKANTSQYLIVFLISAF